MDSHLGETVRTIIRRSGDTIKEAATKLGESEQNLYTILRKEEQNTAFLRTVSKVYKIPFQAFFGGKTYNVNQQGNGNIVGETNTSYVLEAETIKAELTGCKRENELLKRQIELLEKLINK